MTKMIEVESTLREGSVAISDNAYGYYVLETLINGEHTIDCDLTLQDLEELVNKLTMLILQRKRGENS